MEAVTIKEELKKRLPQKRYEHVLRVRDTALRLADRFGVPPASAETAAYFHDIAKAMSREGQRELIGGTAEGRELLSYHPELWHALSGAVIAKEEFGVDDEDVLMAIRYHTTGRAGMSPLEKLIYVADMIEPGREFSGVGQLREAAEQSLNAAMRACIIHSVRHLLNKEVPVHPDSIDCYNEMVSL